MEKSRKIFFMLIFFAVATACSNGERQNSHDSAATELSKDTSSSTTLPDTMYDNVNEDSIQ